MQNLGNTLVLGPILYSSLLACSLLAYCLFISTYVEYGHAKYVFYITLSNT